MVDIKAGHNPVIDTTEFSELPEAFTELGAALEKADDGNTQGGFLRLVDNKPADFSDDQYVINYDEKLLTANTTDGQTARAAYRKFASEAKKIHANFKLNGSTLGYEAEKLAQTLDAIEAKLPKDTAAAPVSVPKPATPRQTAPTVVVKPTAPVVANPASDTLPTIALDAKMGKNTIDSLLFTDSTNEVFSQSGDKVLLIVNFEKIIKKDDYRSLFITITKLAIDNIEGKLKKSGVTPKNITKKLTPEQLEFIKLLGQSHTLANNLNNMNGSAKMGKSTSAGITGIDSTHDFFKLDNQAVSFNVDLKKLGSDANYRNSFIDKSGKILSLIFDKLQNAGVTSENANKLLKPDQLEFIDRLKTANITAKSIQGLAKNSEAPKTEGAANVPASSDDSKNSPLGLATAMLAVGGAAFLVGYTFVDSWFADRQFQIMNQQLMDDQKVYK